MTTQAKTSSINCNVHCSDIQQHDVVFGSNALCEGHVGTIAFKAIIESRLDMYVSKTIRKEKTALTRRVLHMIQSTGARFLTQANQVESDLWYQLNATEARLKVREAFRYIVKNIRKQRQPSVLLGKIGLSKLVNNETTYIAIVEYVAQSSAIQNFVSSRNRSSQRRKQRRVACSSFVQNCPSSVSKLPSGPVRLSSCATGEGTAASFSACIEESKVQKVEIVAAHASPSSASSMSPVQGLSAAPGLTSQSLLSVQASPLVITVDTETLLNDIGSSPPSMNDEAFTSFFFADHPDDGSKWHDESSLISDECPIEQALEMAVQEVDQRLEHAVYQDYNHHQQNSSIPSTTLLNSRAIHTENLDDDNYTF